MMTACITIGSPHGVVPPSYPPVAAFSPGDITIPNFSPLTFADESTNTPTSWTWFVDGAVFAITKNANYFFSTSGDHEIKLIVQNSYGQDETTHTVTVNGGPVIP